MGGVSDVSSYDDLMPSRLKRYQTQGHDHFITFSCHHRAPCLNDDQARTIFEDTLEKLRRRHQFFLYGYVLMPEHVHLLLSEPKLQSLARRAVLFASGHSQALTLIFQIFRKTGSGV